MVRREVIPLKQGLDYVLVLPGSKSITNRALLCAALAKGKSKLYGVLESDDTHVMMKALKKLGIKVRRTKDYIEIIGCGQKFEKKRKLTLDLHNSGTSVRFLTAIMTIREEDTVITGDKRMQKRPIADLAEGLKQLGADITYLKKKGYPPLKISNLKSQISNLNEHVVRMRGDKSSQYFSALLMLGPLLNKPLRIKVIGELVSKPYIDITLSVLKDFGIKVKNNNYKSFVIKPQKYKATDYQIEGDASAASYWTSMAYLYKGQVKFENLSKKSVQGDVAYPSALKRLGKGKIDMTDMPDVAMTLAVTGPFIKGQTKITGLSTLRIKETDRLAALEKELKKVGVKVKTTKDSITVQGLRTKDYGLSRNIIINTYNDHRMAMCFAVVGTKIPGIVIENTGCVEKTYPQFWEDLEKAYLKPIKLGQKNLILTGMRCTGKTRHGKNIAKLLGHRFIDLDDEIEKDQKMTIPQIVKHYSWPYFRKIEQKICTRFANAKNLVIATGGGVVLNPKNVKALKKNGVNVFIFADPSVIVERIKRKSGTRPSLTGKHPVKEIYDVWLKRRNLYLKYADFVWDNTSGKVLGENLENIFTNSSSKIRIRLFRTSDASELARLHRGTIRAINSQYYPPEAIKVWSGKKSAKKFLDQRKDYICYVALIADKIVGFSQLSKTADSFGLYVHKDYIRQGVGSRLAQKIESVARKKGLKKFTLLSTINAKSFYEKLGYRTVKKTKHKMGRISVDVYLMEKILQ